jgi:hypothetical protein
MIGPQPDLFKQPRHAEDSDVQWLENLLDWQKGWMTSSEILRAVFKDATENKQRWLRELASESVWIISGQRGYKHLKHATAEEIEHAANWLESQAKKMSDRAGGIRRNAHRIFG